MELARMNELYRKGLYSPANYYLGLLALLKAGADVATFISLVPESLVGTILDIAARHHESGNSALDDRENRIVQEIVAWGRSLHGEHLAGPRTS